MELSPNPKHPSRLAVLHPILSLALVLQGASSAGCAQAPLTEVSAGVLIADLQVPSKAAAAVRELLRLEHGVLVPLLENGLAPGGPLSPERSTDAARHDAHCVLAQVCVLQADGSLGISNTVVVNRLQLGLSDSSMAVRHACVEGLARVAPEFRLQVATRLAESLEGHTQDDANISEPTLLPAYADSLRRIGVATPAVKAALYRVLANPTDAYANYWRLVRESTDDLMITALGDLEVLARERAALAYVRLTGVTADAVPQWLNGLDDRGVCAALRALSQVAKSQSSPNQIEAEQYGQPLTIATAEWMAVNGALQSADQPTMESVTYGLLALFRRADMPRTALAAHFLPLVGSQQDAKTTKLAQKIVQAAAGG